MTLLVTLLAALFCTAVWYKSAAWREMKIGVLTLVYWGASLMWLVDAVFAYIEDGAAIFSPSTGEMVNDLFLGVCALALGMLIWLAVLLIRDPKGVVRASLARKDGRS